MNFDGMKRKQLQALCRKYGIPGNLKNCEIIDRLACIFKENEEPASVKDGDEKILFQGKTTKKVTFSPDNEIFEFTRSVKRPKGRTKKLQSQEHTQDVPEVGKVTRRSKRNLAKNNTECGTVMVQGDEMNSTIGAPLIQPSLLPEECAEEKKGLRRSKRAATNNNAQVEAVGNEPQCTSLGVDITRPQTDCETQVIQNQTRRSTRNEVKGKIVSKQSKRIAGNVDAEGQTVPILENELLVEVEKKTGKQPRRSTHSSKEGCNLRRSKRLAADDSASETDTNQQYLKAEIKVIGKQLKRSFKDSQELQNNLRRSKRYATNAGAQDGNHSKDITELHAVVGAHELEKQPRNSLRNGGKEAQVGVQSKRIAADENVTGGAPEINVIDLTAEFDNNEHVKGEIQKFENRRKRPPTKVGLESQKSLRRSKRFAAQEDEQVRALGAEVDHRKKEVESKAIIKVPRRSTRNCVLHSLGEAPSPVKEIFVEVNKDRLSPLSKSSTKADRGKKNKGTEIQTVEKEVMPTQTTLPLEEFATKDAMLEPDAATKSNDVVTSNNKLIDQSSSKKSKGSKNKGVKGKPLRLAEDSYALSEDGTISSAMRTENTLMEKPVYVCVNTESNNLDFEKIAQENTEDAMDHNVHKKKEVVSKAIINVPRRSTRSCVLHSLGEAPTPVKQIFVEVNKDRLTKADQRKNNKRTEIQTVEKEVSSTQTTLPLEFATKDVILEPDAAKNSNDVVTSNSKLIDQCSSKKRKGSKNKGVKGEPLRLFEVSYALSEDETLSSMRTENTLMEKPIYVCVDTDSMQLDFEKIAQETKEEAMDHNVTRAQIIGLTVEAELPYNISVEKTSVGAKSDSILRSFYQEDSIAGKVAEPETRTVHNDTNYSNISTSEETLGLTNDHVRKSVEEPELDAPNNYVGDTESNHGLISEEPDEIKKETFVSSMEIDRDEKLIQEKSLLEDVKNRSSHSKGIYRDYDDEKIILEKVLKAESLPEIDVEGLQEKLRCKQDKLNVSSETSPMNETTPTNTSICAEGRPRTEEEPIEIAFPDKYAGVADHVEHGNHEDTAPNVVEKDNENKPGQAATDSSGESWNETTSKFIDGEAADRAIESGKFTTERSMMLGDEPEEVGNTPMAESKMDHNDYDDTEQKSNSMVLDQSAERIIEDLQAVEGLEEAADFSGQSGPYPIRERNLMVGDGHEAGKTITTEIVMECTNEAIKLKDHETVVGQADQQKAEHHDTSEGSNNEDDPNGYGIFTTPEKNLMLGDEPIQAGKTVITKAVMEYTGDLINLKANAVLPGQVEQKAEDRLVTEGSESKAAEFQEDSKLFSTPEKELLLGDELDEVGTTGLTELVVDYADEVEKTNSNKSHKHEVEKLRHLPPTVASDESVNHDNEGDYIVSLEKLISDSISIDTEEAKSCAATFKEGVADEDVHPETIYDEKKTTRTNGTLFVASPEELGSAALLGQGHETVTGDGTAYCQMSEETQTKARNFDISFGFSDGQAIHLEDNFDAFPSSTPGDKADIKQSNDHDSLLASTHTERELMTVPNTENTVADFHVYSPIAISPERNLDNELEETGEEDRAEAMAVYKVNITELKGKEMVIAENDEQTTQKLVHEEGDCSHLAYERTADELPNEFEIFTAPEENLVLEDKAYEAGNILIAATSTNYNSENIELNAKTIDAVEGVEASRELDIYDAENSCLSPLKSASPQKIAAARNYSASSSKYTVKARSRDLEEARTGATPMKGRETDNKAISKFMSSRKETIDNSGSYVHVTAATASLDNVHVTTASDFTVAEADESYAACPGEPGSTTLDYEHGLAVTAEESAYCMKLEEVATENRDSCTQVMTDNLNDSALLASGFSSRSASKKDLHNIKNDYQSDDPQIVGAPRTSSVVFSEGGKAALMHNEDIRMDMDERDTTGKDSEIKAMVFHEKSPLFTSPERNLMLSYDDTEKEQEISGAGGLPGQDDDAIESKASINIVEEDGLLTQEPTGAKYRISDLKETDQTESLVVLSTCGYNGAMSEEKQVYVTSQSREEHDLGPDCHSSCPKKIEIGNLDPDNEGKVAAEPHFQHNSTTICNTESKYSEQMELSAGELSVHGEVGPDSLHIPLNSMHPPLLFSPAESISMDISEASVELTDLHDKNHKGSEGWNSDKLDGSPKCRDNDSDMFDQKANVSNMIFRTQMKPKRHDMKENAHISKIVETINVTAPRTSKRRPHQDLC